MATPDVTWAEDFFSGPCRIPENMKPKSYSSGTTRTAPLSALVAKAA
jgi:GDP-D-mannose dehydratase